MAVVEDVEEEVEEEVVTVGEVVEMGVVFGAEVADGDVEELLALVVMLLMLSACGISIYHKVTLVNNTINLDPLKIHEIFKWYVM